MVSIPGGQGIAGHIVESKRPLLAEEDVDFRFESNRLVIPAGETEALEEPSAPPEVAALTPSESPAVASRARTRGTSSRTTCPQLPHSETHAPHFTHRSSMISLW